MDLRTAETVISSEPLLSTISQLELLDRGHSPDRKFVLIEAGTPRYLLRFSDINQQERRRSEFEVLGRLASRGVKSPSAILFGVTADSTACYTVTDYILGEDAETLLPELSTQQQQHALGLEAGEQLRLLHAEEPPVSQVDWLDRHRQLYGHGVDAANAAGISIPEGELAARYVAANHAALADATAGLMHNDFAPANLIVLDGHLSGIIDFELWDWGDPVHDFHKLPWFTTQISVAFAQGQIVGYWADAAIPFSFWRRYNLHVAMSLPRMLAFISHVDPQQLPDWTSRAQQIVDTHDLQHGGPPTWFQ